MSAVAHAAGGTAATAPDPGDAAVPRKRPWTAYLLLLPGGLWLLVFFVLPIAQLFTVSLQSGFPGFPGYYYRDVNAGNYLTALTDFAGHFGRSLLYAALATLFAFVLAYPLAYAMAFKAGRWRSVMMICVIAPFFTSFILRTIAWRQILADEGPVASVLNTLHLLPGGRITETWMAVVAGLTYNFLPFMVLPIYASLERADARVIEAGGDLYANGFTTFRTVTLPISMPGVIAGTLLTFIPAAGDYVNAELLGSDRSTKMVGNVIESQFFRVLGGFPVAAALSFTLMALILALVFAYIRRFGTENLLVNAVKSWVADRFAMIAALAVLVYLFVPVAYTFAFSFNDYRKSNIVWNGAAGPTLKHWKDPCGAAGVCDALVTSLQVGLLATVVATVLGTMLAFALVRHRFRGRATSNVLIFIPMATPEIVLGASLLTIFVQGFSRFGLRLGFWTIVIAHIMFCISFVVVTVKARLLSLDPRLEEAAQDLYAGPGGTFWRVTFPLVLPGVVGAALLSFSLSFDDFIITNFVSGDETTFPKFVYVSYLRGIPAQANVIGFSMFVIAVALVVAGQLVGNARKK